MRVGAALLFTTLLASGCGQEEPKSDREYIRAATALNDAGRYKDTVNELKAALLANPRNTEARWMLGQTYITLGEGEGAEKELRRAADLGIDWAEMLVPIARAQILQGDLEGAIATLDTHPVVATTQLGQVLTMRGDILSLKHDPAAAARRYAEALGVSPVPIDAFIGDARLRFQYGDRALAMTRLEDAALIDARNIELACSQGLVALADGDVETAKAAFIRLLDSSSEYDRKRACAYRNLLAIANRGDSKERTRWLDGLTREFGDADTRLLLDAIARLHAGRLVAAQNDLESYSRRNPSGDAGNFHLALTYARLGHWQQAIGPARAYRDARPHDARGVRLEALINVGLGRFPAAAEALLAQLWDDPDDLTSLVFLGVLAGVERPDDLVEDEFAQRLLVELGVEFPLAPYVWPYPDRTRAASGFWATITQVSEMTPVAMDTIRSQIRLHLDAELDVTIDDLKLARADRFSTWLLATRVALLRDADLSALRASQQAQRLAPDNALVAFYAAYVKYVTTGGKDVAASAAALSDRFPEFISGHVIAAAAALGERDIPTAIAYLDRLLATHDSEALQTLRVRLAVAAGDDDAALAMLNALVASRPDAHALKVSIAQIQARKAHWAEVQAALASLPAAYGQRKIVRNLKASAAMATGDLQTAVAEYQGLLDVDPDDVDSLESLARAQLLRGKGGSAMKLAQRLQMERVGDPRGYRLEGDVAKQLGDHRAAAFAYQSARDLAPSRDLTVLLSEAWAASGDYERALEVLDDGLHRYEQDRELMLRRADTLWLADRRELAVYELAGIIEQFPAFPGRDAVSARLETWRKTIDPAADEVPDQLVDPDAGQ